MSNRMIIKPSWVLLLTLLIMACTMLSALLAYQHSRQLMLTRLSQHEMPAVVGQVSQALAAKVSEMTMATQQLAENPYILQWAEQGFSAEGEALLLQQLNLLKQQLGLAAASWADQQTNRYWKYEGFLRVLNPQQDSWYFAFVESGATTNVSLYTEPDGEVLMFVNYRQPQGRGLSGIAVSMRQLVDLLSKVQLAETGLVYLADSNGNISIHPDTRMIGKQTLAQLYGDSPAQALLANNKQQMAETDELLLMSMPVAGTSWSVVAQVPKAEVLAPVQQLRTTLLLTGLAISLLAGLLILLGYKVMARIFERR